MKNLSTKTKILIGVGIVLAIFIIFLFILAGSSGGNNIPNEEKLQTTISGITCQYDDDKEVTYDISTITNDIHFDNSLATRNYKKIVINTEEDFKSLGVGFIIKCNSEANFNIKLMKNSEVVTTNSVVLKAGEYKTVDLHLENSIDVLNSDEFYITIEQNTSFPFAFVTFIFFMSEV